MDASLLTSPNFWTDERVFSFGKLPDDPQFKDCVLFETSGSSGRPKWVVISKAALLASAAVVNRHLDISPSSRWGLALPLHHVGGFGMAARAYVAGCKLEVFPQRWDAVAFTTWLEQKGISHSSLVPTQVHDLVKNNSPAPACVRAIVVGGGHLDIATGQAARELGWPVLASYGMTEASSQIATQGLEYLQGPYQPAPIPLLPHWQVRVGVEELLEVSGPALFSGYLVMENNKYTFSPLSTEWYVTADRVLLDRYLLTPLGRADTIVKVLGELVDPAEIERELFGLSEGRFAIGSYTILALPDVRAGHRLVPIFENSLSPEFVASVLEKYNSAAPKFRRLPPCYWVSSIPKSPLGKILKFELPPGAGAQDS